MNFKAKIQQKVIKFGISGMIGLTTVLYGGTTFAQQEKTDVTRSGQVTSTNVSDLNAPTRSSAIKESAQETSLLQEAAAANTSSATFGSLALTVQVDQTYCGSGGVQCTGPGLSPVIPAQGNRNPVRLVLQVLNGTTPVNGLTDADINISNSFVPAGGTAVTQLSCPTCFQSAGNGLYAIFVNPAGVANWKSGSYHVQVQVLVGLRTHRALAQIEIPF